MAEVIVGITLEAAAKNLLEAVTEAKDRAVRFAASLADLETTVKRLLPKITKIEELSQELGELPKDEIQRMKQLLVEAKQLVSKCSEVACWNFCKRDNYSKKLLQVRAALRWLIEEEFPVAHSEDLVRILHEVKRMSRNSVFCFLFHVHIFHLSRNSVGMGLGDQSQRDIGNINDNDGISKSGRTKVLPPDMPVVSGFKRRWIVSLFGLIRRFPCEWL
ncbi:uncharacterized protein LOC132186559 [Corylus avellana]|uniref:uncharacterized protein LOC132186559 n=1 Tax=Corylus avellana TaxID=13451 RepID=UPI00286C21B0|nr:uncharacterized protein LOC132186559 [Corylus avellana]